MTSLAAVLDNSNEALAQKPSLTDSRPPSSPTPPIDNSPDTSHPPPPHSDPPSHHSSSPSPTPAPAPVPASTSAPPAPVPPPPPPLQTIRLEIKLGGPDKYEVDVAAMAKQTGQRPPTPAAQTSKPEEDASSESDSQQQQDGDGAGTKKKKRKKKKNTASEYYDITDPFIDDSELAIDERTWFAQTKQQGFYVSSGEVALLKDKSKKPKSKKPASSTGAAAANATATASTAPPRPPSSKSKQENGGSKDYPITVGDDSALLDDGDTGGARATASLKSEEDGEEVGQKRKRYITVVDHSGKRRKVVDINSFPAEMQVEIDVLKEAISKENWTQKGKFPPTIKPMLANLAMLAVKMGEYEDHFFNLMPTLFPYNKFTMMKLIKRTVFQDHVKYLVDKQEALLNELADLAKAGFAKAEEEWEKSVQAWDKRQEKARLEAAAAAASGGEVEGGDVSVTAPPTRHPTEEMDVDGAEGTKDKDKDKDKDAGGSGAQPHSTAPGKDSHPPSKKYRLTETMKAIVWQLVMLSNECCRLENEKNSLEGSVIQVSEQGSRKVLYQKIVAAFPEGWMSSGQISRDVSSMKKRFEKEALENEAGNV